MESTWVVVADEAIARILEKDTAGSGLQSVEELTDPDAHAKDAEFRHDAHGRRSGGSPSGAQEQGAGRVTASAGKDQQHLEAERFAKRVAAHLQDALNQKRFSALQLVASPRFLGLLRKSLSAELAQRVTDSLDKDFVHLDDQEISARLFQHQPANG